MSVKKQTETKSEEVTVASFVEKGELYSYGTEDAVSDRFLQGGSLDVIQRLEPICNESFPQKQKSMAFLVPYGYSSSASTAVTIDIEETKAEGEELKQNVSKENLKIDNNVTGNSNAFDLGSSKGSIKEKTTEGKKTENKERTAYFIPQDESVTEQVVEKRNQLLKQQTDLQGKITQLKESLNFVVEENQLLISGLIEKKNAPGLSPSAIANIDSKITELEVVSLNLRLGTKNKVDNLVSELKDTDKKIVDYERANKSYFGLSNLKSASQVEEKGIETVYSSIPSFNGGFYKTPVEELQGSCGEYDFGALVFLMNPEKITTSINSLYKTSDTWGDITEGRSLQWGSNDNAILSLEDIQLPGITFRRVVQPIVDEAFDLLLKPADGNYEPRVFSFIWGERKFEPCIVESVRVTESAWFKGKSVVASISLTLRKVPRWQINDGIDVIVYDPKLTNSPAIDVTTDNANTATTVSENNTATTSNTDKSKNNDRSDLRCSKPYKCASDKDFRKLKESAAYSNKTTSREDLLLVQILERCMATAYDDTRLGQKIPPASTEEKSKCDWDTCCKTFLKLIEEKDKKNSGTGNGLSSVGQLQKSDCKTVNLDNISGVIRDRVIPTMIRAYQDIFGVYLPNSIVSNKGSNAQRASDLFRTTIYPKYQNDRDASNLIRETQRKVFGIDYEDKNFKSIGRDKFSIGGFVDSVFNNLAGINDDLQNSFNTVGFYRALVNPALDAYFGLSKVELELVKPGVYLPGLGSKFVDFTHDKSKKLLPATRSANDSLRKARTNLSDYRSAMIDAAKIIDAVNELTNKGKLSSILGITSLCGKNP